MKIDNTQFTMWMKCPLLWYERYEAEYATEDLSQGQRASLGGDLGGGGGGAPKPGSGVQVDGGDVQGGVLLPVIQSRVQGIELDEPSEGRDFGSRFHQLLHSRRLRLLSLPVPEQPEWPESIEAEAQSTLAQYEQHYIREYDYLESERTSTVPLPANCPVCWTPGVSGSKLGEDERYCPRCEEIFGVHQLVVKIDAVVRHGDGTIGPMDTKTENKPGYNTREDWAGKTQAKIYLYALSTLYPDERVSRFVLDVVTRGSAKGRRGPIFSRTDDIACAQGAIEEAIRNVVGVAEDIERSRRVGFWRSNMNVCKRGWEKCDFYDLHVLGRTSGNLKKYRPAEKYLDL